MATRLGPRSLTLHTPSRERTTESSVLGIELVADLGHARNLPRGRLGAALRVCRVDVALEGDHAFGAVDVDLHGLQPDVGGEGALHLAGKGGVLGRALGIGADLLRLL